MDQRPTIEGDLKMMGLSRQWLEGYLTADTFEAVTKKFDEAKKEIRRRFRKKSLKLHPDAGGDQKEFVKLQQAYDRLMKLRVNRPQPRPSVVITTWTSGGGSWWTSNSFTDDTTGW